MINSVRFMPIKSSVSFGNNVKSSFEVCNYRQDPEKDDYTRLRKGEVLPVPQSDFSLVTGSTKMTFDYNKLLNNMKDGERRIFGRRDINSYDPKISRTHFDIVKHDNDLIIHDYSRNGTFIKSDDYFIKYFGENLSVHHK